jgi:hypothetical protein
MKILVVVGLIPQESRVLEQGSHGCEHLLVKDPVFLPPSLVPWVGIIDEKGVYVTGREYLTQITSVGSNNDSV